MWILFWHIFSALCFCILWIPFFHLFCSLMWKTFLKCPVSFGLLFTWVKPSRQSEAVRERARLVWRSLILGRSGETQGCLTEEQCRSLLLGQSPQRQVLHSPAYWVYTWLPEFWELGRKRRSQYSECICRLLPSIFQSHFLEWPLCFSISHTCGIPKIQIFSDSSL